MIVWPAMSHWNHLWQVNQRTRLRVQKLVTVNNLMFYALKHRVALHLDVLSCVRVSQFIHIPYPEPVYTGWSTVHWNATGWPSVHWDTTGRSSDFLQGTLEHYWNNLVEAALHWNATGETIFQPTLGHHWTDCNSPHTPRHMLSRVASMPIWNDKMAGHQSASGQSSVNSDFTWSLLLSNVYQFCS